MDSQRIMDITLNEFNTHPTAFICTNIQKPTSLVMQKTSHVMPNVCRSLTETLSGLLRRCSQMIASVVMADHGNDPTIGHSHHTREVVPVLVYQQGMVATQLVCAPRFLMWGYRM